MYALRRRRGIRAGDFRRGRNSRNRLFFFAAHDNRSNDGQHGDDGEQFLHTPASIKETATGHKPKFRANSSGLADRSPPKSISPSQPPKPAYSSSCFKLRPINT